VRFDYRIIAVLTMVMLLIIGVAIISGLHVKIAIPSEFLTMQMGIG
jgi:hypothetical protein